jgi:endonuclease/exonuclease/phosphatase family metal-dependent hydrolase
MSTRLTDRPTAPTTPQLGARFSGSFAAFVYLTIAVSLMMECLRVLFPIVYAYERSAGIQRTGLVLLVTMLVPGITPSVMRRFGITTTVLAAAVLVAGLRVVLQAVDEIPLLLAAAIVAATLFAVVAGMLRLGAEPFTLALAFVAGLALDTTIRAIWLTWDDAWRPGLGPLLVALVLVALLVGAAALSARDSPDGPNRMPARGALTLGLYLFFQVLFVQSPAYVASSARVALAAAIAVVLVGDLVALLAVGMLTRVPWRTGVGLLAIVALAGLAWTLTSATGVTVIPIVLAVQFLVTAVFVNALQAPPPPAQRHDQITTASTIAGGFVLFAVLLVLYQLHYDTPLPFTNRWIPVFAAALMSFGAVQRAPTQALARSHDGWMLRLTGVIVVAGAAVVGGLAASEPSPSPVATRDLRVMTYNIDETVTRHGQLNPNVFVATVRKLHPDVLVVEEGGRGWLLSGTMDLGEWAKRHLDMPYVWAPAADHQFGNLLFSRVPITSVHWFSLPQGTGTMKRSAIIAEVGSVGGKTVTVIGTHLQNGHTAAAKQTRVEEIGVLLGEWRNAPRTVIAGDLNSDPGSRELRTIMAAGFSTTQPAYECTLKTSNKNCVDWILVTSDVHQSPPTVLPIETYDHRPLISTVTPR